MKAEARCKLRVFVDGNYVAFFERALLKLTRLLMGHYDARRLRLPADLGGSMSMNSTI
jgi:hypothetical protein